MQKKSLNASPCNDRVGLRHRLALALFSLGLDTLGLLVLPPIQGGWSTGAGHKLTCPGLNGGSIVSDPAGIDLGEYGIWFGIKQTLGGATPLYGSEDRLPAVKIIVPGDMAVTVATAGDSLQTITHTFPDGSTETTQGKIVGVTGPNYQANNVDGDQKVVTIQTDGPFA